MAKGGRRPGAGRKPGSYLIPDDQVVQTYWQYRASKPDHPQLRDLGKLLVMNPRHLRLRLDRLELEWPFGHALAAAAALGVTWFLDADGKVDGIIHVAHILLSLTTGHPRHHL
jgi:hypothetical protein